MIPFLELNKASVVRGKQTILKDLSLKINLGEQVAILGPNGAGKSTLLKMLSGDIFPVYRDVPAIRLFGEERWNLFDLRGQLSVVSGNLQEQLYPDSTGINIILSGFFGSIDIFKNHQVSAAQTKMALKIAKELGLNKLIHKTVDTLSSGELRRFLIGRALINHPRVIVLDEPTVSLDIQSRTYFLQNIRHLAQNDLSIIIVTHLLEEIIPEITRVIILKDGKIFEDGNKSRVLRSSVLSKVFNLPLKVEKNGGYYRFR